MLQGKNLDFISLQVDYWDSPWQNRHAFLWEISKQNRVFFLSPPFYLVDILNRAVSMKTTMRGLSLIKENLYSYVPPRYLPYNLRFPRLDSLIRCARHYRIRKKLKDLKFENPILYIWHPNYANMVGEFGESLVIYHKYDNYAGYLGGTGKVDKEEMELLKKADLVFVTSQGLYDLHKDQCEEIHLVPNGVDFELFSRTLTDSVNIPSDMDRIPVPRIGYVGVINEKVDFDLLTFICKSHRDWSIILVGPTSVKLPEFQGKLRKLQAQENCYFLGQKDIKQVPAYIEGLDVCMMCYLINDWTYYGYPLKMHEYLASGKPTVATGLPAIKEFGDVIMIPRSKEGWVKAIERSLNENDPHLVQNRIEVARQNSYPFRIRFAMDVIEKRFAKKTA